MLRNFFEKHNYLLKIISTAKILTFDIYSTNISSSHNAISFMKSYEKGNIRRNIIWLNKYLVLWFFLCSDFRICLNKYILKLGDLKNSFFKRVEDVLTLFGVSFIKNTLLKEWKFYSIEIIKMFQFIVGNEIMYCWKFLFNVQPIDGVK